MILKEIKPENLTDDDYNIDSVFIEIPFLYSPILRELKRREMVIKRLYIKINLELVSKKHVLLSFLRICSIPESITENGETAIFTYRDKILEMEFTNSGMLFEGSCELGESVLIFSENMPYIKVENNDGEESVIVLPEGDGFYYMNLDKKESENEHRTSIIGTPAVLKDLNRWLLEQSNGKIISL